MRIVDVSPASSRLWTKAVLWHQHLARIEPINQASSVYNNMHTSVLNANRLRSTNWIRSAHFKLEPGHCQHTNYSFRGQITELFMTKLTKCAIKCIANGHGEQTRLLFAPIQRFKDNKCDDQTISRRSNTFIFPQKVVLWMYKTSNKVDKRMHEVSNQLIT